MDGRLVATWHDFPSNTKTSRMLHFAPQCRCHNISLSKGSCIPASQPRLLKLHAPSPQMRPYAEVGRVVEKAAARQQHLGFRNTSGAGTHAGHTSCRDSVPGSPKPKREGKPAQIILHPCSNFLESTILPKPEAVSSPSIWPCQRAPRLPPKPTTRLRYEEAKVQLKAQLQGEHEKRPEV